MASDLTPEELAELRRLAEEAAVCRRQFEGRITARMAAVLVTKLPKLLDMAERCADYDRRLTEVMPADFKDWHQNSRREWPEVAAGVVTNLRERLEQAERAAENREAQEIASAIAAARRSDA